MAHLSREAPGRSPGSWVRRLSRALGAASSFPDLPIEAQWLLEATSHLQWRDRAGFAPASLLMPSRAPGADQVVNGDTHTPARASSSTRRTRLLQCTHSRVRVRVHFASRACVRERACTRVAARVPCFTRSAVRRADGNALALDVRLPVFAPSQSVPTLARGRAKREPGANPGLSRSGEQERTSPSALVRKTGKRRPVEAPAKAGRACESEDLPVARVQRARGLVEPPQERGAPTTGQPHRLGKWPALSSRSCETTAQPRRTS